MEATILESVASSRSVVGSSHFGCRPPFWRQKAKEENMKTANLLLLAIALTGANSTYQWLGPGNYAQAFDRSFFQPVALALVAVINKRPAMDAALAKCFPGKERP